MVMFYFCNVALIFGFNGQIQLIHDNAINIMYVACGDGEVAQNAIQAIKLAILFSHSKLIFHLVVENETRQVFESQYAKYPDRIKKRVSYIYYDTWFPEEDFEWWRNEYKLCATQKVFANHVINTTNKVLFMDVDTFILSNLEKIWSNFDLFTKTTVIGFTPDCNIAGLCAYGRRGNAHVPVVGDYGINSGIMYMRLDRMREFKFTEKITNLLRIYKGRLIFPEQDLLNILFHNDTNKHVVFKSEYNYFDYYCWKKQRSHGFYSDFRDIKIFHGAGGTIGTDQKLINHLNKKLKEINFNWNTEEEILIKLKNKLERYIPDNVQCYNIRENIFENFKKEINYRENLSNRFY